MDEGLDIVTKVNVHPLVLLHVLDHHTRRQEASGRVIGTLLGRRDGKKVEVTNCFAVPHAERGDEVAIGKDFNKQMLALHLRANKKETVVGWYASAAVGDDSDEGSPDLIANTSSLIHEFYAEESDEGDPVHLVVDTRLLEDAIKARVYRSTPVVVQGEPMANMFHELRLTIKNSEPETLALHRMVADSKLRKTDEEGSVELAEPLLVSMERLFNLLEAASDYVDSVVEGKTAPDAEIGRKIADTLATVPRVRPEVFDKLFNDSLQDLLMVTYLSNITQTQLLIAEKLNSSLGV
jgi:translation initiation factor 3 subunit F